MDYSSQARNATTAEPQRVLVVLDPVHSRKAARYFQAGETERQNIMEDLEARDARYFIGDDTSPEGPSVREAYEEALQVLEQATLAGGSENVLPYAETFEAMEAFRS